MITRIVKLTIREQDTIRFADFVRGYADKIGASEGCNHLKILQDKTNPCIFFTYSIWEDETYLEKYRHSELFEEIWGSAKTFFGARPEAWTTIEMN